MKKLIFIGLLVILIVFTSGCISTISPGEYEYCSENQHNGTSINGTCSSNNDCVIGGCNGEICGNEPMDSICIYNPPYPKDLGCSCKCVDNKCMWAK